MHTKEPPGHDRGARSKPPVNTHCEHRTTHEQKRKHPQETQITKPYSTLNTLLTWLKYVYYFRTLVISTSMHLQYTRYRSSLGVHINSTLGLCPRKGASRSFRCAHQQAGDRRTAFDPQKMSRSQTWLAEVSALRSDRAKSLVSDPTGTL